MVNVMVLYMSQKAFLYVSAKIASFLINSGLQIRSKLLLSYWTAYILF